MRTVVQYSVISWFSTSALWERTSTPCIESAMPAICEMAFLAASDQLSLEVPTKSSTLNHQLPTGLYAKKPGPLLTVPARATTILPRRFINRVLLYLAYPFIERG